MWSFPESLARFVMVGIALCTAASTMRLCFADVVPSDTVKVTDESGKVINDFFGKPAMRTVNETDENSGAAFLITLPFSPGVTQGQIYLTEPDPCPKPDKDCKPSSFASDTIGISKTTVQGKDALAVQFLSDCPKATDCVIQIPDGATKIPETGAFQDVTRYFFPDLFDPKTGALKDPKKPPPFRLNIQSDVPEPAAWPLMAGSLVLVLARARRKRTKD